MSDSVYSFRAGPTYRGALPEETFQAALDMPMSRTATFFDQAKGGALESFGLGTAIRDLSTPAGDEPTFDAEAGVRTLLIAPYEAARRTLNYFRDDSPALSEDAYKSSAYYRDDIPWDAAMTEDRAASLAESFDAKKVREFYAEKRPITSFIGNLSGQAVDPINYIPVAGPAVKAAAAARLGRVAGASVAASLDAAANTAIFGLATAPVRARHGDDISWQATVSQIATAALIGAGFGAIGGVLEGRGAATGRQAIEERLATLKTTQEARIALNEGIGALVRGEDINLSPNVTEPVRRVAGDVDRVATTEQAQAVARDAPPIDESAYVPAKQLSQAYTAQYEVDGKVIASSRSTPSTAEIPPVGTWRISDVAGLYGRDIERLQEVEIDSLVTPELRDGQLDPSKRGDDATYAGWMKEGKEAPPIEIIRREDGSLRVTDGHRRVLAAKSTGAKTIKGWVSELTEVPGGKVDSQGRPMKTSLTYEIARQQNAATSTHSPEIAGLLDSPELKAAVERMDAIPRTDQAEGYGTPEWFDNRTYDFDGEKVHGFEPAVDRLIERARRLASKQTGTEPYPVTKGRQATIVIGTPAAGKSTIANVIAIRRRAAIADVDDAKEVMPEYQGGIGANAVHEESADLGRAALDRLMISGDNLVVPKVGHNPAGIELLRQNLKDAGYEVDLVLMDVTPEAALGRMLARYEKTGRLVNPAFFVEVAPKPKHTYADLKSKGTFDGYSVVKSDDGVPASVAESQGAVPSLALGEQLDPGGTIRADRPDQRGGGERRRPGSQSQPVVDTTTARPEDLPWGLLAAQKVVGKPDAPREMAEQYGVDLATGDFAEMADIEQLRSMGRLTDADEAALAAASEVFEAAEAYGNTLKAAVRCVV